MCTILERSGYLDIWKVEMAKNPWQYDLDLMHREPKRGMDEYCGDVLRNERGDPNRYVQNRGGYEGFAEQFGRRYFAVMADLYATLARLHAQRVDVAQRWLQARGML